MSEQGVFKIRELARQWRVSPAVIYRLVQAGHIPAVKVGGQWRCTAEAMESYLSAGRSSQGVSA